MTYLNKNQIQYFKESEKYNEIHLQFIEELIFDYKDDPSSDLIIKFDSQDDLNQYINELNDSTKLFIKI